MGKMGGGIEPEKGLRGRGSCGPVVGWTRDEEMFDSRKNRCPVYGHDWQARLSAIPSTHGAFGGPRRRPKGQGASSVWGDPPCLFAGMS